METKLLFICCILLYSSCGESHTGELPFGHADNQIIDKKKSELKVPVNTDIPIIQRNDIVDFYKSHRKEGVPIYGDTESEITHKIMSIIQNYDKINAYTNWSDYGNTWFEEDDIMVEVKKYNINGKLAKITTEKYERLGKTISEYYLQNEKLSFIYKEKHEYNSPHDSKNFNPDISSITEYGYFFHNGILFHRVIRVKDTDNQIISSDENELKPDHDYIMKIFSKMINN